MFHMTILTSANALPECSMQTTILRLPEVKARTGLSRSSIYQKVSENSFPVPVSLGGKRAVGWIESEVQVWIEEQIKLSRPDQ
jgi:prophage regulatory protein